MNALDIPETLEEDDLKRVALFPLPNAVLFPSTILPLHIFEPRYRTMTREAIEHQLPIVICKFVEPRQLNVQQQPLFCDVGGVGFIRNYQQLPDGRYNILVEGVSRVKVIEEIFDTGKPYRVGQAELIAEQSDTSGALGALITTLKRCVTGLEAEYTTLSQALQKILGEVQNPAALSDTIASLIVSNPEVRQHMLEEPRVERRLDELITRIAALLNASQGSTPQKDPWLN